MPCTHGASQRKQPSRLRDFATLVQQNHTQATRAGQSLCCLAAPSHVRACMPGTRTADARRVVERRRLGDALKAFAVPVLHSMNAAPLKSCQAQRSLVVCMCATRRTLKTTNGGYISTHTRTTAGSGASYLSGTGPAATANAASAAHAAARSWEGAARRIARAASAPRLQLQLRRRAGQSSALRHVRWASYGVVLPGFYSAFSWTASVL